MNTFVEMGKRLSVHNAEFPQVGDIDDPAFFRASDLEGLSIPPREYAVQGFVPARTVTLLGGNGGDGKSLLALQLATSTVLGRMWLGQEVQQGRALYVGAEDDKDEIHRRLAAIRESEGVNFLDLGDLILRSLAGEDALLAIPDGKSQVLQETPLFLTLEKYIERHRPKLTVLDTLADLYGGDENGRSQARQFIGILRGLALRCDTTILLLAHPSLSGMSSGSGTSGSTAWNNSVRSRIYLQRVKTSDGDQPDPDARVLEVMKNNYGETGNKINMRWENGVFVPDIRNEGTLDRLASEAKADRVFLTLVRTYAEQGRDVGHAHAANYAPKIFSKDPNSEGVGKRALEGAMNRLFNRNRIKVETYGPQSRVKRRLVEAFGESN